MDFKPRTFYTDMKDLFIISDGPLLVIVFVFVAGLVLVLGPKNAPAVHITQEQAKSLIGYPDHIEGCHRTGQAYPYMPTGEVHYLFKCEVNNDKKLLNISKDSP